MTLGQAERRAERSQCLHHPDALLTVVIKDGEYVSQCNACRREGRRSLIGQAPNQNLRRGATMSQSLATRSSEALALMHVQDVRVLLGVEKATDTEVQQFVRYC